VYFGLSAGLQQLHVSHIGLGLRNNVFESCEVSVSVSGGNAYGGAVSIYMGAYSSRLNFSGDAAAAVGDTVVRNVSVTLDTARFASCSARREINGLGNGSNVYGGSFSFYIGAYAWSLSDASSSSSTCGATDVIGVDVRVRHATSVDCTAITRVSLLPNASDAQSLGANSYGGAMSALYVGAYSYSDSNGAFKMSSSASVTNTHAHLLSITIKRSSFQNSMALSSEWYLLIFDAKDLTRFKISETGLKSQAGDSYGANVSSSDAASPFFVCDTASRWRVILRRFTAAQSASWSGLLFGRLWELEALPHHAAPSSATSAVF
jgi:hypothetical protein